MATTTNYGWAEPDNTSLVKNGAQDIRILGDAIDASVWNIGYGQAGKNKIINGDFGINQRGFTTTTTNSTYTFDRWITEFLSVTTTYSTQAFTPGTAPVAGYEATNFARIVTASAAAGSYALIAQRIENVRTFANQTITMSFWAKAGSGTPKISARATQIFGTGGSGFVAVNASTPATISTSWARYSFTINIPSIAGKTIGTGSSLAMSVIVDDDLIGTGVGIQNNTFDIWGVQVEYGSKATPFQTASGGSPQAELAMCQRYYYRATAGLAYAMFSAGSCAGTGAASFGIQFPVTMRTAPASVETTGTAANYAITNATGGVVTCSAVPVYDSNTNSNLGILVGATSSGLVAGDATQLRANNSTTAYIGWSAEL